MSGLRFCFLTTFYPPYNFGGDGIAIQRLARALVRDGHRVTVVHDVDAFTTLSPTPAPPRQPEPEGLEVVSLRSGVGALSALLTQQFGRPVFNGRRIARLLADGAFDVLNFHNVSLIGGPGLLRYGTGVKLYMAHEHWLVCPTHVLWRHRREPCPGRQCFRCQLAYHRPPQLWRSTGYLNRQLQHVDSFIAMSQFSRAKHREFGFPREMEVLPSFLPEVAEGDPGPRPQVRPYFLFVGRLERIKGLQDVIPAFAGPGAADLLVAGQGEFEAELRRQAEGMERVKFLGRVASEGLAPYYRHAVSLIMPSLGFETFGITVLEAFRQATPVLARRLGPLPELIERSSGGELFATRAELVAAMEGLLRDPARREALGQQAHRAFHEHWTDHAVLPAYLAIVAEAAARKGHTRIVAALPRRAPHPARS